MHEVVVHDSANQTLFCLCLRALRTKIFWNNRNIEKIGSKLKIPRIVSFRVPVSTAQTEKNWGENLGKQDSLFGGLMSRTRYFSEGVLTL